MIPLIIFLWFYFLIGFGASLRVMVESKESFSKTISGGLLIIVAWPYIIGVRLMG
jgi:hypothetical protein